MSEISEIKPAPLPKPEICTIRIMFPVTSDEQAIGFKTKITELLSEVPDVIIHFGISTAPTNVPMR